MRQRFLKLISMIISMILLASACAPKGQPDVVDVVEENGPTIVTGQVTYTNAFFTDGVAQPVIILEDQTGFVKRDRKFLIPVESQVIAKITSDFFTSPFTSSFTLYCEFL